MSIATSLLVVAGVLWLVGAALFVPLLFPAVDDVELADWANGLAEVQ